VVLTRDAGYKAEGVAVVHSIDELLCCVGFEGRRAGTGTEPDPIGALPGFGAEAGLSAPPGPPSPPEAGAGAQMIGGRVAYVCGGAEIYRLLMPYTDTCLVTRIDSAFGADTFFPNLDSEKFTGPGGEEKRYILAGESAPIEENDLSSGLTVTYRFCEYRAVFAGAGGEGLR
jgi:hypothetical protein